MLKAFIYTPSTKASGKAKKYVQNRNVHVVVIDDSKGQFKNITSRCIVQKKTIAERVDSRFTGNRSAYGRSLKEAENYLHQLKLNTPMLLIQEL